MKIKIEIKHYLTGAVLFEFEKENNTQRDTILEAIRQNANLRSADLRSADLRSANLRFADLSFADLRSADLRSANLRFADLSFANLSSANLRSANLRSANLRSANLRFAENLDSNATDYWWHIHHETLYEWLTEPLRARINYIKTKKAKNETKAQIELRLKLLKPVLGKIPSTEAGWNKLHKKECVDCPWNGYSIFPSKK